MIDRGCYYWTSKQIQHTHPAWSTSHSSFYTPLMGSVLSFVCPNRTPSLSILDWLKKSWALASTCNSLLFKDYLALYPGQWIAYMQVPGSGSYPSLFPIPFLLLYYLCLVSRQESPGSALRARLPCTFKAQMPTISDLYVQYAFPAVLLYNSATVKSCLMS